MKIIMAKSREMDSNHRPGAYGAPELPLLYPASGGPIGFTLPGYEKWRIITARSIMTRTYGSVLRLTLPPGREDAPLYVL